ncbi:mariner transposase [Trichonephila clavipes]|nr:mariner transposase [Trichonephila clavipes]
MDRISICEALAKRNEIDPFLKQMVTGHEKWVTYDSIVRKQSWSKRGEVAQTVVTPCITARKAVFYIWWDWKGIIYYVAFVWPNTKFRTLLSATGPFEASDIQESANSSIRTTPDHTCL